MQTNGNVISRPTVPSSAHVWEAAKGWARKTITQERMIDAALALVALDGVGFVIFSLHKAFTEYSMTGF
jgi:hypothetical protein